MAKSDKWSDQWYRGLPVAYKCFWEYLRDRCDNAGVWTVDFGLASFCVGNAVDNRALEAFGDRVRIVSSDKWQINGFAKKSAQGSLFESPADADVQDIVNHWATASKKHPPKKSTSPSSAWAKVVARLRDGCAKSDIKQAISKVCNDQWHVENGRIGLPYICRSSAKIEEVLLMKARPIAVETPEHLARFREYASNHGVTVGHLEAVLGDVDKATSKEDIARWTKAIKEATGE